MFTPYIRHLQPPAGRLLYPAGQHPADASPQRRPAQDPRHTSDRIARKLSLQQKELADCSDREKWKIYGDLINANLYSLQKGDRSATLGNFYDENQAEITIPLDPRKTPSQNAQKYYGEYRKSDTAEKKLRELIAQGQQEAEYIDSVFDALTRAQTNDELTAIRAELVEQGYLRRKGPAAKKGKEPKLSPKRYRSDDGFTILVGRNNVQNDQLTLKEAHGRDVWFHTKNIPGSHTVVLSEGREVPDSTLHQARFWLRSTPKPPTPPRCRSITP